LLILYNAGGVRTIKDQIHLFYSRRFLPLFITQFFGGFNDNACKNALLIWVTYDIAQQLPYSADKIVALAAGVFILPFLLFSTTAGQLADKYQKSWLTIKIKQLEIILMICYSVSFFLKDVSLLLVILFLMGTQSTFFGPIKYSLLPEHLQRDELIGGNGLIEGGTFLAILLGTIFGGLIVRAPYGVALLSGFVLLFAIVGWRSSCYIPDAKINDQSLKVGFNIFKETYKVISYSRRNILVWLTIIGISWFWLIGAIFLTQLPIYTKKVLYADEYIVTLLLTVFSVGIGIGSVWCNKLLRGNINADLVPYGAIGISAAIISLVIASYFYMSGVNANVVTISGELIGIKQFLTNSVISWLILLSLFLMAIFGGIYTVPLYAIMQYRASKRYLSRIIAANNIMNAVFMVAASVISIVMLSINLNVIQIFLIVGILNIIVYFYIRSIVIRRAKHRLRQEARK
jgi:acyl-[acyl-carrier-protein]-phospholipid O-acyltransferase/long-chain-fatty-acid--[acyl-carrier-protein] ligase